MGAVSFPRHPAAPILGAAWLCYAALSLLWAKGDPVTASLQLAGLALGFSLGVWLKSIRLLWIGFYMVVGIALLLSGLNWLQTGSNELVNPNMLGCVLAVALAAAIGYRHWAFIPVALGGLWFCESRTALIGACAAVLVGFWQRFRATGILLALLAVLCILTATKVSAGDSLWHRLGVWQDTLNHLTFWGSGWGSFSAEYAGFAVKRNMTMLLAPHAYNDILEMLFELGIGSTFLWAAIAFSLEGQNPTDRLVCLTFLTLSLTYFPLVVAGPMVALSLGHLSQTKDESPWLVGSCLPRTT